MSHFSQRYPKIPVFDFSAHSRASIAFDGMVVSPDTLPALNSLLVPLQLIFKSTVEIEKDGE